MTIAEVERRYVERVLALLGGNKTRAAQVLGIDRRTLHRKVDLWKGQGQSCATDSGDLSHPRDD
jgi:DNA-binding NtrC family response regulator